jgi:hypothetical protein
MSSFAGLSREPCLKVIFLSFPIREIIRLRRQLHRHDRLVISLLMNDVAALRALVPQMSLLLLAIQRKSHGDVVIFLETHSPTLAHRVGRTQQTVLVQVGTPRAPHPPFPETPHGEDEQEEPARAHPDSNAHLGTCSHSVAAGASRGDKTVNGDR